MILETERLLIRPWRVADRVHYARFNADPIVRRFYPKIPTATESDAIVDRFIAGYEADGFGFLAVERKQDGAFIGDVGLGPMSFSVHGDPKVEIGWLLGRDYWGQGYAPEAARAWLAYGFGTLGLPEIVAFTATVNLPSRRVMTKLGMARDPEGDFGHPGIPPAHPLHQHVLYRIANPAAQSSRSAT